MTGQTDKQALGRVQFLWWCVHSSDRKYSLSLRRLTNWSLISCCFIHNHVTI